MIDNLLNKYDDIKQNKPNKTKIEYEKQKQKMKWIEKNIVYNEKEIGDGPKKHWWQRQRNMNQKNLQSFANVLCKIFNSPSLILYKGFFDKFADEFEDEMKKLLKLLAQNWLNEIRTKSNKKK